MNRAANQTKFRRTALIIVFAIFATISLGQWEGPRLSAFIEGGYNSNPAQLTSDEITQFGAGDPGWMRLTSTDDALFRAGLSGEYRVRIREWRVISVIDYRYNKFLHNSEMDYHFIRPSLMLRKGDFRADAALAYMPRYAYALFHDSDFPGEARFWAEYSMIRGEFEARFDMFDNHSFGIAGQVEYNEYNENFPEYDGVSFRVGPSWRWSGPVYLRMHYAYRVYNARGFDIEGHVVETSLKTDISFVEDRIEGYISRRFYLFSRRALLGASWRLSRRYYTSEKDFHIDYIHVARRDLRADISPFISCDATDRLNIRLGYSFTIRESDSPYFDLKPLKNYARSMAYLRLEYSIIR
ncbi:MAG TPA: hypothetical protein ENN07_04005 [candidate division Zixibacteria bacterium]|nr:hypothetical protein [candidate division Zixibacteria bacterium]